MKYLLATTICCSVLMMFGCGKKSDTTPGSDSTNTTASLTGAGSTFIEPVMTHWVAEYGKATGVKVNYQGVGSGAGINNLIDKTVDFVGSDAPMNANELERAKDPVIHIPAVIGAVCVCYNVSGVESPLNLDGEVIANIFLGKIIYWDDAAIKALNKGVKLPHEKIFTVHRSDGSGTTAIFTNYLSKVSSDWKTTIGEGKTVNWPENGLGGKGNAGVAGILKEHANSIGYVELAYAEQNKIAYAQVKNSSGNFIAPSVESASLAADGMQLPPDMIAWITNTANPQGYPITGFSWCIFYKSAAKSPEVKKFIHWVTTDGQNDCKALYYAPIPEAIRKMEAAAMDATAAK
ncbi:MAG TPA: phosphate ABC transporter substrate-binding protein PstS [Candidatus Kapabacteria bacterium]|nr:phosphate ABC transporter substrate-binding protein PstS [Candidatus Kapabacteria bacterium]